MGKAQRTDNNNNLYAKYVGQRKNGKPDGHGMGVAYDGGIYEGEWKDGKEHGQGTFTFSNGWKFVVEYKNGEYWNITGYDKNGNIIIKVVNGKLE